MIGIQEFVIYEAIDINDSHGWKGNSWHRRLEEHVIEKMLGGVWLDGAMLGALDIQVLVAWEVDFHINVVYEFTNRVERHGRVWIASRQDSWIMILLILQDLFLLSFLAFCDSFDSWSPWHRIPLRTWRLSINVQGWISLSLPPTFLLFLAFVTHWCYLPV